MSPPSQKSAKPDSPTLVFVDVDNTLVKGATIFMFAIEAWKSGYIKWRHVIPAQLSGAFGTQLMESDGKFTGEINGDLLHGPLKEERAQAFAAEVGADLSQCYAYSDSAADIPLLSLVGHPVAVNPDATLLAHASHAGWPVMWPEASGRSQSGRNK